MRSETISYRPDIDGLRALAVLLVLLFHFGLGAPGGFVGVDVFFVISGFLITEVIRGAIDQQRFSFWQFYGRRLRRLHPALVATAALSLVAGCILMDPASLIELSRTVTPTLLAFSNLYFWQHSGYFDAAAHTNPLLHTWSLATEWQFYLLWPAIIWGALKASRTAAIATLLALTVVSLAASQAMLSYNASAAYYMMPFRVFELAMGGLLVFGPRARGGPAAESAIFVLGLTLILSAAFLLDAAQPFPGLRALLPCLGAVACIHGGQSRAAGVFRVKPLVYVGLMSYSVYLIHWPLLVFYRYYIFRELHLIEALTLVSLSLLLGAMLYHSVERVLVGRVAARHAVAFGALVAAVVAVSAGAEALIRANGLTSRVDRRYLAYTTDPSEFHIKNYGGAGFALSSVLGDPQGEVVAVMGGDSFAHQYANGMDHELRQAGQSVTALFIHGCVLSKEYTRLLDGVPRQDCRDAYAKMLALLDHTTLPFIFAEAWQTYRALVADGAGHDAVTAERDYAAVIDDLLSRARVDLGDRDFVIVGSQPIPPGTLPTAACLLRPRYVPQGCDEFLRFQIQRSAAYDINQVLRKFAASHARTFYVDSTAAFCQSDTCNTVLEGRILYSDNAHLSLDGSVVASRQILKDIRAQIGLPAVRAVATDGAALSR